MPALSPDSFPDCDAWRAIIAESLLAFARANWMDAIDFDNWMPAGGSGYSSGKFKGRSYPLLHPIQLNSASAALRMLTLGAHRCENPRTAGAIEPRSIVTWESLPGNQEPGSQQKEKP